VLIIWKLDRLGRFLPHLVQVMNDLLARQVGLKSLKRHCLYNEGG